MHKSGFVCLIGRTNVGKSSLLNNVLKTKIAITSNKPQTTRNSIKGILNSDDYQIVFVDNPGIFKPKREIDLRMQKQSYSSLNDSDLCLFMTTPLKEMLEGDKIILNNLKKYNIKTILVINKIEYAKDKKALNKQIEEYLSIYPFIEVVLISVLENKNIDILLNKILENLEEGPKYFLEDELSDRPIRFIISELIREKVLLLTEEEIPHSICVLIDSIKQNEENTNYKDIYATIVCERESQKKIIVGKNGLMIKTIKEKSIQDIKRLLKSKIHLDLFVKVKKNWRNSNILLNQLGYKEDEF